MGFCGSLQMVWGTGGEVLDKQLWEICREQWQNMRPRKTYQDIADESGVSVNAVAQFIRGETKNTYIQTAAPICKALGVSIDDAYGIKCTGRSSEADDLRQELTHTRQVCRIYKRVATGFGVLVGLALIALIVDLLNPNVGWFREALGLSMQWLHL